ncbi:MAG: hypothetical protein KF757_03575 [Phycisphaeraceae bacterium]|nr:hypothetical protein [Phycisphaeraceae bacterium]MCW5763083.1 hypothetical protein [Phycisphaeraceae bacterium]
MIRKLMRLLSLTQGRDDGASIGIELPTIERERIAHLLRIEENLPHLDWAAAWTMIERESNKDEVAASQLARAIVAAWLDELRDAMPTDSRRWRGWAVEGLAPLEGTIGKRVASYAERSLHVIGEAFASIRGSVRDEPIPPIAIIVLATADEYYSFISAYYDEGAFATSGGVYLRESPSNCAALIINAQTRYSVNAAIAHELAHHALVPITEAGRLGAGLPLWAEEGLTQMMEERVTGVSNFVFSREMRERHMQLWSEIGFDGLASGETFHSPDGEEQELSYNLAEAITRSLLSTRPGDFFAFARACVQDGVDAEDAAIAHLGKDVQEIARDMLQV